MVDFLGIGVQKGGTTWLFHQLAQHPQVCFPRGKEMHFWDTPGNSSGEEWQALLSPPHANTTDGRPIRTGEITPAYALLPVETIAAIRRQSPGIRVFISLRNPVERAWSAALMGLARAEMFAHEASDAWFLDHFHSSASLARGDYGGCIARWRQVFPEDQLLVLLHDDIAADPVVVLHRLARHLAIDAVDFAKTPPDRLSRVVVPALSGVPPLYRSQLGLPLRPSLQEPLLRLYVPQIDRLQDLLGRDLSHWKEPSALSRHGRTRERHEVSFSGV